MVKVAEFTTIQPLGSFETLGSKLRHGIPWIPSIVHWTIEPAVRTT